MFFFILPDVKLKSDTLDINQIIEQVPPDYYEIGYSKNILQRFWHDKKLKISLSLIKSQPKKILDAGCASGFMLSKIKQQSPQSQCFGIDIYPKTIKYGQKQYRDLNLEVADAHLLPFKNASFDLVLCLEVLEHVRNPLQVLEEIKRVLTPDGKLILEMDTGNVLFKLIWFIWTRTKGRVWKNAHINEFTTKRLERIIKQSGFKIEQKKVFNFSTAVAFLLTKNYQLNIYK